jgi:hypothetical protein
MRVRVHSQQGGQRAQAATRAHLNKLINKIIYLFIYFKF